MHKTEDADLAKAKVVSINAAADQTTLNRDEAYALLSPCHTAGVVQLSIPSSTISRPAWAGLGRYAGVRNLEYVMVKMDCSRPVSGGNALLAVVGIYNSAVKTVFLNVEPLLIMELSDPPQ